MEIIYGATAMVLIKIDNIYAASTIGNILDIKMRQKAGSEIA